MNKGIMLGLLVCMVSAQAGRRDDVEIKRGLIRILREDRSRASAVWAPHATDVQGWDSKIYDNHMRVVINPHNTHERLLRTCNGVVGCMAVVVLRRWQDGHLKIRLYTVRSAVERTFAGGEEDDVCKGKKIRSSVVTTTEIH